MKNILCLNKIAAIGTNLLDKNEYFVLTDAPNLMRIVDNIFSNLRKYADINEPICFGNRVENNKLYIECKNKTIYLNN